MILFWRPVLHKIFWVYSENIDIILATAEINGFYRYYFPNSTYVNTWYSVLLFRKLKLLLLYVSLLTVYREKLFSVFLYTFRTLYSAKTYLQQCCLSARRTTRWSAMCSPTPIRWSASLCWTSSTSSCRSTYRPSWPIRTIWTNICATCMICISGKYF